MLRGHKRCPLYPLKTIFLKLNPPAPTVFLALLHFKENQTTLPKFLIIIFKLND